MKRFLFCLFGIFIFTTSHSQEKKIIDAINKLYIQGLNIPLDSIVFLFQNNLKNAENINDQLGMADAYSQLSLVSGYQGKYEECARNTIEGIKIYEGLNQMDRVADY